MPTSSICAGSNFNDTLIGDNNNNFLRGGLGADVLNGGAGSDTADYGSASAGLTVDLGAPANNTGEAIGDSYISIENLRGSTFNDILRGDGNSNLLDGASAPTCSTVAWAPRLRLVQLGDGGRDRQPGHPASNTGDAAGR